jgi:hypothetical protein
MKANMWLNHREETDNCKILHERTGPEFKLQELPRLNVDGFVPTRNKFTNFVDAISTVTRVSSTAIFPQFEKATHSLIDMSRKWIA